MSVWYIILCHSVAEANAAKAFVAQKYPAGTKVFFEKDPPVAPDTAGVTVSVKEFITDGANAQLAPRQPSAAPGADNGPFYVVHAITP